MDLIYIGKLVNTHGIKGEVRIISDFKYKDVIFKKDNYIYINKEKYKIVSHRRHKMFDMLMLDGIESIENASKLKGKDVYIDRLEYTFDGYLNEDLIGMDVYNDNIHKGKIVEILKGVKYDILVIEGVKRHLIPYIDEFIKEIDVKNNRIDINYIKGLDNED